MTGIQPGTADLLQRIASGDEAACRIFFNEYKTMVASLCYKLMGSRTDISEMVQIAFIEIFKALKGYRGDANIKTWIYRICANHCFKEIRAHTAAGRHFVQNETAMLNAEDRSGTPNPEAALLAKEQRQRIDAALQGLTPEKRLVLILHDMEECTMQEIAGIVGVPLGTVKTRLFHARKEMQQKLRKYTDSL